MQNFWELLLVLSSLTSQHTITDIARLTNTTMEPIVNTEYLGFYKSVAPIKLKLKNNTVIATMIIQDIKEYASEPLQIGLQDLRGVCLSRSMLKEHMTEFSFLRLSSSGFSERAKFNGKFVWLGFKSSNPECISDIVLNFYDMKKYG